LVPLLGPRGLDVPLGALGQRVALIAGLPEVGVHRAAVAALGVLALDLAPVVLRSGHDAVVRHDVQNVLHHCTSSRLAMSLMRSPEAPSTFISASDIS